MEAGGWSRWVRFCFNFLVTWLVFRSIFIINCVTGHWSMYCFVFLHFKAK